MVGVINQDIGRHWALYHGDSCEVLPGLPSDSVHFMIYSPPFASLYTYSNSERDLGNCKSTMEFYDHYRFIVDQLYRILKPGRLLSFHCMNLPSTKERDGFIGIKDFRGDLIRIHMGDDAYAYYIVAKAMRDRAFKLSLNENNVDDQTKAAKLNDAAREIDEELKLHPQKFILHSEVVIWKDPVTAMQRTKAIGLLYKQLRKDSCISRQGIPDYLVTMRKPGTNEEPVTKTDDGFPVGRWQNYASPVWMDINPYDTLQRESAREDEDERHICPLQLQVIDRALELWTNPNDVVLSPFAGIGSEGFCAVHMGRRFIGVELKESYYKQACGNMRSAMLARNQTGLFEAQ